MLGMADNGVRRFAVRSRRRRTGRCVWAHTSASGVHRGSFRLVLECRSSCCDKTFSVNPGGGPTETANPNKAHHQARSHPLLYGEPVGFFRNLPGYGKKVES